MTIVTSYDVESETWTHHQGETPARQAFRAAVADIAAKAKETLPECHGRVDKAVAIVLNGDVELLPEGKAKVGSQREYLQWLLHVCTAGKIEPEMILTTDAIDLLASKLRTPLQMQRHLTLALEVGYQTGEQPISAGMVDTVLSQQFDDLEPTLTRHGYHLTDLVQQCDAKPTEIKALVSNQLNPTRTAALRDRMLRAGLPLYARSVAPNVVLAPWIAVPRG